MSALKFLLQAFRATPRPEQNPRFLEMCTFGDHFFESFFLVSGLHVFTHGRIASIPRAAKQQGPELESTGCDLTCADSCYMFLQV